VQIRDDFGRPVDGYITAPAGSTAGFFRPSTPGRGSVGEGIALRCRLEAGQIVAPDWMTTMRTRFPRRRFLEAAGAGLLGHSVPGMADGAEQAAKPLVRPELAPLNRFPRMVQEYFVDAVRRSGRTSSSALDALKTRAEAEAHVLLVRDKIRRCFGPFPEKTPLDPRITGVVERDRYRIEKVVFESRPGFLVTANLYLPKASRPLPGVVGTCGHSANGKAGETYQSFAQGLARMGYICLLFDPFGQGERLDYAHMTVKPAICAGVGEHLYAGNQQALVGEFLGAWRAWDGIRALDYLLTRPEVDHRHIGLTGNSGGGTMTTWLCGLDQRWTMAAPGCFVTTFRRNMENELPADTEQYPPKALALGLDHADFIAALAPKPVILLGKEKDYFDVRGLEEAYGRLKRLYTLLGAKDHIELQVGPTYHGYTQENREAMYRWFNRITGISEARSEPKLVIEKDETLHCAPGGRITGLNSKRLFAFTWEKSKALTANRPARTGEALARIVSSRLRLRPREVPEYRILRPLSGREFPKKNSAVYAVETEPGIHALVYRLGDEILYSRPPGGQKRAILYVSHQSADAEVREDPFIRDLMRAEPESIFFSCDVRGIGESLPGTCQPDSFLAPYGSDFFYAGHSIMLDRPYAGQRTHDVLSVLDWLRAHGHSEVHLAARGCGAIPAAFAAVLAPAVVQVTLKNALVSYSAVAESETYRWPLSAIVPGVLEDFDLPDCYRVLEAKGLRQVEPWGPDAG
jgi:dienelactone hydrolase